MKYESENKYFIIGYLEHSGHVFKKEHYKMKEPNLNAALELYQTYPPTRILKKKTKEKKHHCRLIGYLPLNIFFLDE